MAAKMGFFDPPNFGPPKNTQKEPFYTKMTKIIDKTRFFNKITEILTFLSNSAANSKKH